MKMKDLESVEKSVKALGLLIGAAGAAIAGRAVGADKEVKKILSKGKTKKRKGKH